MDKIADYKTYVSLEEALKAPQTDTLCWDCAKAMKHGLCSWSDPEQQEPVEGWTAEETTMGFRVISCPNFERCTYGGGRYRTADEYIETLEERVRKDIKQIRNMKKTMWWKHVNRLRMDKIALKEQISMLTEQLKQYEGRENKENVQTNDRGLSEVFHESR